MGEPLTQHLAPGSGVHAERVGVVALQRGRSAALDEEEGGRRSLVEKGADDIEPLLKTFALFSTRRAPE